MRRAKPIAALLMAAIALASAHAAPYIPASGAQVVEHLPSRTDPVQREFKRLRAELAAAPDNLPLALDLARRYIDQARSEGDPRYFGYAQAALAPWWNQVHSPVPVRVLRATLLQSTHQFPQALLDLNAVLRTDRDNAQAWLTRATILLVQGEFEQAKSSCARLDRLAPELIASTCVNNVANLNGQAEKSYATLHASLQKNTDAAPAIQLWVRTLLAEMAVRNGNRIAAEAHFREALAIDGNDHYLLAAYADFLLDQQRAPEVVTLLKNKTKADALLLRYALALQALRAPATAEQIDILQARFNAAMLRGDTVHQREQARFELHLLHHADTALALAQANWNVQKEPADVRILMEAALAAKNKAAAQPVLSWLKQTGLEDRALTALKAKIEGGAQA